MVVGSAFRLCQYHDSKDMRAETGPSVVARSARRKHRHHEHSIHAQTPTCHKTTAAAAATAHGRVARWPTNYSYLLTSCVVREWGRQKHDAAREEEEDEEDVCKTPPNKPRIVGK